MMLNGKIMEGSGGSSLQNNNETANSQTIQEDVQLEQMVMEPNTNQFIEYAEEYSVIPLAGKVPLEQNWRESCHSKRGQWAADYPGCNAGICCGPASELLVLDVDDVDAFDHLTKVNGFDVPETYTVRTGGGGLHLYFRYPDDGNTYGCRSLKHPAFRNHTIIDVRGDGGYVVAAGSVHPDTNRLYEVEKDVPKTDAPEWLLNYVLTGALNKDALWGCPLPSPESEEFVRDLKVSDDSRNLILQGTQIGQRSEANGKVLGALKGAGYEDRLIFFIFDHYPIGEKYRGKGSSKRGWLQGEIRRSQEYIDTHRQDTGENQDQPDCPACVLELNKQHAIVMLGGKCVVLNEDFDPVFMRKDISFSNTEDFNKRYANRREPNPYTNGHSESSIAKIWFESPYRRQYDGLVFSPDKDVPGYYNLYRGRGVEPVHGDWSLMRRHIHEVIASGNEEIERYVLHWLADLVQHPGGPRPGTAIILRGKQGTGKGSFVSQLGEIIGPHFMHITNQHHLTGRFNNHLKDALLVFVDEGFWGGNKTIEGPLKGLVTEEQVMIEPKGKDPFMVKNNIRLIIASNNEWVVPAGKEERRFFVIDVTETHIQDKEYFGALYRQMDSGGREAMLYDLLHMDITGYDLRSFPRTQALLDQIVNSMSSFERYWYDQLYSGTLGQADANWGEVFVDDFYEGYLKSAQAMGQRHRLSKSQVGKELRKLCPGVQKVRQRPSPNLYREFIYILPELDDCRKAFEEKVNIKVDWDAPVSDDDTKPKGDDE